MRQRGLSKGPLPVPTMDITPSRLCECSMLSCLLQRVSYMSLSTGPVGCFLV